MTDNVNLLNAESNSKLIDPISQHIRCGIDLPPDGEIDRIDPAQAPGAQETAKPPARNAVVEQAMKH
jgi:hypothetical protein